MNPLTADYSEIINDRKLVRETTERERPTSDVRKLKWREIEELQYKNALEWLEPDDYIQIG